MPVFQRFFTATRIDVCSSLVCIKCLTECIAASGAVSCPCCSDDPSCVRPASNAILLCCYQMLEDIVLVATWTLEVVIMKGMSVYHVPSLTPEEERQAAELLKRAISTSPDKGVVQLATGGAVRRCFDCY